MDTKEIPAAKAAATEVPQILITDESTLAIFKTFLTQLEIISVNTSKNCLLIPINRKDAQDPSYFFLKCSVHINKPSIEHRARINIGVKFNMD